MSQRLTNGKSTVRVSDAKAAILSSRGWRPVDKPKPRRKAE